MQLQHLRVETLIEASLVHQLGCLHLDSPFASGSDMGLVRACRACTSAYCKLMQARSYPMRSHVCPLTVTVVVLAGNSGGQSKSGSKFIHSSEADRTAHMELHGIPRATNK